MCRSIIFLVFCFVTASNSSAQERTWTDTTGSHKLKATLVNVKGDTAFLQRSDTDRIISIPLAKLSESDRKVVEIFRVAMAKSRVESENSHGKLQRTTSATEKPSGKFSGNRGAKNLGTLSDTKLLEEKLKEAKRRFLQLVAEVDALKIENARLKELIAKSEGNASRSKWLKHGEGRTTKLENEVVFRDSLGQVEVIIHEVQTGERCVLSGLVGKHQLEAARKHDKTIVCFRVSVKNISLRKDVFVSRSHFSILCGNGGQRPSDLSVENDISGDLPIGRFARGWTGGEIYSDTVPEALIFQPTTAGITATSPPLKRDLFQKEE